MGQNETDSEPEGAVSALQDRFKSTERGMFKEAATNGNHTDLGGHTETVTAYISKCIYDIAFTKMAGSGVSESAQDARC